MITKSMETYRVKQAFAFLAIRSLLRLPISFPGTTGCKNQVWVEL